MTTIPASRIKNHGDHFFVESTLTISPNAGRYLQSVATPHSSEAAALLARLLEGQQVRVHIHSATNISYFTDHEQLDMATEVARASWDNCFLGEFFEESVARLKTRFGQGNMGMSARPMLFSESMDVIKQLAKQLKAAAA